MTTNSNAREIVAPPLEVRGLTPDEVHRIIGLLYCEVILLQREKEELRRQLAEAQREP